MNKILLIIVLLIILFLLSSQEKMKWYTIEFENGSKVSFNAVSIDKHNFFDAEGELIYSFDSYVSIQEEPKKKWLKNKIMWKS